MNKPPAILADNVEDVFRTGNGDNFFGYYDKSPFDATDRYLLTHRVHFPSRRDIRADDSAELVKWDIQTGGETVLAETHAFNWQQGAHLQWLGPDFASRIIFNDYRDKQYVSVIKDLQTSAETVLPMPIYSVAPCGKWAICVNYDRLFWCRPGYRYEQGGNHKFDCDIHPDDGLWHLDLDTGKATRIISTTGMAELNPVSSMDNATHYLEHVLVSPNGARFMFMHRWQTKDGGLVTRVYTAAPDGSDLRLASDSGDVSHYAWRGNDQLLLFGSMTPGLNRIRRSKLLSAFLLKPLRPVFKAIVRPGKRFEKHLLRSHYHLVDIMGGKHGYVGKDTIWLDGHPSFDPHNADRFCSDSYQNPQSYRELFFYDIRNQQRTELGQFYSPPETNDRAWRCDLHPRFDHSGKRICIDSLHSGSRQVHVIHFDHG